MTIELIIEKHGHKLDRELFLTILLEISLLNQKIDSFMSQAAVDLQTLVDQLKAGQAATTTALNGIKASVAAIVTGLPEGAMSAEEVAALKASLVDVVATEQANAQEASADATAVAAAAQPAPAPAPTPVETPPAA